MNPSETRGIDRGDAVGQFTPQAEQAVVDAVSNLARFASPGCARRGPIPLSATPGRDGVSPVRDQERTPLPTTTPG